MQMMLRMYFLPTKFSPLLTTSLRIQAIPVNLHTVPTTTTNNGNSPKKDWYFLTSSSKGEVTIYHLTRFLENLIETTQLCLACMWTILCISIPLTLIMTYLILPLLINPLYLFITIPVGVLIMITRKTNELYTHYVNHVILRWNVLWHK